MCLKIINIFGAIVFNGLIIVSSLWSFIWSMGFEDEIHLISD